MERSIKLAVVGATGLVGRSFLKVLEEFKLPIDSYELFASKKSEGKKIKFMGKDYEIKELREDSFENNFDFALFSAGSKISEKFAPIAAKSGCVVIDNSSYFRLKDEVPLVIPQINLGDIKDNDKIIANPNCSTIQAALALYPLHKRYKIKRIVISTYQAVSGAGQRGCNDLLNGIKSYIDGTSYELEKFKKPIFNNAIPQIDEFLDNGYTKEEMKMVEETKKIFHENSILITTTAVRIPVFNCHSESINIEFEKDYEINELREILSQAKGVIVKDDISNLKYPLSSECQGKNEVFVGRIRRDESVKSGVNMWVVADNIRKGAATNAVEILACLINRGL